MLKFLQSSVKGDKDGCRAAGRTGGCAGVENTAAKGLGSKSKNKCKIQIAGLGRSRAAGLRV